MKIKNDELKDEKMREILSTMKPEEVLRLWTEFHELAEECGERLKECTFGELQIIKKYIDQIINNRKSK